MKFAAATLKVKAKSLILPTYPTCHMHVINKSPSHSGCETNADDSLDTRREYFVCKCEAWGGESGCVLLIRFVCINCLALAQILFALGDIDI